MKGKGLLIAAAVIQLVGAAFLLLGALSSLVMMPAMMQAIPDAHAATAASSVMRVVGGLYLVLSGFMTWVSIKLIQRRRWAWIVSLVMSCLTALFMLLGMVGVALGSAAALGHRGMSIGFGEVILLFIIGSPVFVVIGLLIGGRHATVGAAAPSA